MSEFHERVSSQQVSQIFSLAKDAGYLDESTLSLIVHDLGRMRHRIQQLSERFPPSTIHALAIKANPVVRILSEAVQAGMGLEAASMEEVYLAVAAGCPKEKIVYDSPAKTKAELSEALEHGFLINANSIDELERIDELLKQKPSDSLVGLRINPEVGSGSIEHTSVASQTSKFGVSLSSSGELIEQSYVRYPWLNGLHVHVGSQGCSIDLLLQAAKVIQELCDRIEQRCQRQIKFVDIGGGMPAIYHSNATSFDPDEYVDRLNSVASGIMDGRRKIVTEFGRSIQAGCGVTLSRVEYVRPQQSMAVIHVGADFLLRPVYAAKDWSHEFLVLAPDGSIKQDEIRPQTIAGPLCFSGDIIGRDLMLPEICEGDWIAIRDTGAYTLGMWSRHCSRGIPAVLGYDAEGSEKIRLLRNQETPTSMVDFWS